jgi:hypothetical protein
MIKMNLIKENLKQLNTDLNEIIKENKILKEIGDKEDLFEKGEIIFKKKIFQKYKNLYFDNEKFYFEFENFIINKTLNEFENLIIISSKNIKISKIIIFQIIEEIDIIVNNNNNNDNNDKNKNISKLEKKKFEIILDNLISLIYFHSFNIFILNLTLNN